MWRGKAQVDNAAGSAAVSAALLAFPAILQGELAVFMLSLSASPSFSFLLHASLFSQLITKGLQGH